jgi:YVTN family beta-propeller protein
VIIVPSNVGGSKGPSAVSYTFTVGSGSNQGVAFNSTGTKLYVGAGSATNVYSCDMATKAVSSPLTVGTSSKVGVLCLKPDGTKLYAMGIGTAVSVIDTSTFTQSKTINLGSGGQSYTALSSWGTRVWGGAGFLNTGPAPNYTTTGSTSINEIQASDDSSISPITVADASIPQGAYLFRGIAFNSTKLYAVGNQVAVVSLSTNTVSSYFNPAAGYNCYGAIMNPSGTKAYFGYGDRVVVINTSTNAVIKTMTDSSKLPGMSSQGTPFVFSPDGAKLYVGNYAQLNGESAVTVIDAVNDVFLEPIPVPGRSQSANLAISPDGSTLAYTHDIGGVVSIIT